MAPWNSLPITVFPFNFNFFYITHVDTHKKEIEMKNRNWNRTSRSQNRAPWSSLSISVFPLNFNFLHNTCRHICHSNNPFLTMPIPHCFQQDQDLVLTQSLLTFSPAVTTQPSDNPPATSQPKTSNSTASSSSRSSWQRQSAASPSIYTSSPTSPTSTSKAHLTRATRTN